MLGTVLPKQAQLLRSRFKAGVQETLHADDAVRRESVTTAESRRYKHQHRKLKGRNANNLMPRFDFRLKCNSSSTVRADRAPDRNPGEDFQNKTPGQKLNVHFIQIHVKVARLMKTGRAEGLKQILISTDSPAEHESKALWEAFSSAANCEQSKDVEEPPSLGPLCTCLG